MQGNIDTSFATGQRDLFESGLAAEIGMNAYGVWMAIKHHADFETGQAWPGYRRLAELTGLSKNTITAVVRRLIEAKLLRVIRAGSQRGRGQTYIARERLDVRLGKRVLCTILIDYVPARMRGTLNRIDKALSGASDDPEAFAEVEIIPGPGFVWDAAAGVLRASVPASELPAPGPDPIREQALAALRKMLPPAKHGRLLKK